MSIRPGDDLQEQIDGRLRLHRLELPAGVIDSLAEYVRLLSRWNTRINLTSLDLAPPSEAALDRLLVEPAVASRHILLSDQICSDLGSGGGSPGIPLAVMTPHCSWHLVESRSKKCAFLREVGRVLDLSTMVIHQGRFDDVALMSEVVDRVDCVSMRAVRADASLWTTVARLLKTTGRALWFGAESPFPAGFGILANEALPTSGKLIVLRPQEKSVSR
jgi:16S rRNA (guanine527-N7)-methyltransferase